MELVMNKTSAKRSAKKDEALHKALKVLNCLNNDRVYETAWVKGAINACEEALEQPAQRNFCERCGKRASKDQYHIHTCTPPQEPVKQKVKVLYEKDGIQTCEILPAPSWQGLSESEVDELYADWERGLWNYNTFADAIEQALKEKNT